MTCPRCRYEWDVSKSPCPQCGLLVHVPGRSGTRPTGFSQRGVPPIPQTPRIAQNPHSEVPFGRQQSGGMPPVNPPPASRMSVRPQRNGGQQSSRMPSMRRQENTAFPLQPNNAQVPTTPYPRQLPPLEQYTEPQREMEQSQSSLPILPQQEQRGTSRSPSANTQRNMPRSANTSSPDYDNNPFLGRLRRENTPESGNAFTRTSGVVGSENASMRNVPHRPQAQPAQDDRSTENLLREAQRPMRPSRLVTDPLLKERQQRSSVPLTPFASGPTPALPKNAPRLELPPLVPGTLLRGGRYRLRELQGRQEWLNGVFEATWIAQDAQRSGSRVMICELVTPDSKSMLMQSTLRNATMALTSVGRHSHVPTLWDAFSDQGRNFFVFEPIEGESLAAHMRRTGRALPEQDIIECCLQMTEILEILTQQSPQLVHGLIRPEHIIIGHASSEYTLTNFSIVLAGGATQYVVGVDRAHLTPYIAPEFVRGTIDGRADLYSLLATAYHAVTGSPPINAGASIPQSQRLNPTVSAEFDAILARGLRPNIAQRYQRPSELRQDLLTMRSVSGTLTTSNASFTEPDMPRSERPIVLQTTPTVAQTTPKGTLTQVLPSMLASGIMDDQEQKLLLPRPDELPPIPERNDFQQAAFWLVGILICLIIIVIVSRGFM